MFSFFPSSIRFPVPVSCCFCTRCFRLPDGSFLRSSRFFRPTAVSSEAYMNSMQGRILEVLMEQKDEETGLWVGTSKNYLRVAVDRECVQGEILFCRIVGKANIRSANHSASGLDTILQGQVKS
jgi:hypothetical protein